MLFWASLLGCASKMFCGHFAGRKFCQAFRRSLHVSFTSCMFACCSLLPALHLHGGHSVMLEHESQNLSPETPKQMQEWCCLWWTRYLHSDLTTRDVASCLKILDICDSAKAQLFMWTSPNLCESLRNTSSRQGTFHPKLSWR